LNVSSEHIQGQIAKARTMLASVEDRIYELSANSGSDAELTEFVDERARLQARLQALDVALTRAYQDESEEGRAAEREALKAARDAVLEAIQADVKAGEEIARTMAKLIGQIKELDERGRAASVEFGRVIRRLSGDYEHHAWVRENLSHANGQLGAALANQLVESGLFVKIAWCDRVRLPDRVERPGYGVDTFVAERYTGMAKQIETMTADAIKRV
jgi:multidrug efflux pump subunit AcrA (membrane-fusion protein)